MIFLAIYAAIALMAIWIAGGFDHDLDDNYEVIIAGILWPLTLVHWFIQLFKHVKEK